MVNWVLTLDAAFDEAQAIVVLITGDDIARLRTIFLTPNDPAHEKTLTPQARPNVLFEAGMAFGRHPERTVLVSLGETRFFSDIGGRHTIRLTNSAHARQQLLSRLLTAGCPVDSVHRTDWMSEGDFDGAIRTEHDIEEVGLIAESFPVVSPSLVRPLKLLTDELRRNKTLSGKRTLTPERRQLDAFIPLAEEQHWDEHHPQLMVTLHELQRRVFEQTLFSDSELARSHFLTYLRPILEFLEVEFQELLNAPSSSLLDTSKKQ
jgi:CAP12/Pycsar effector protein, TIR domain